MKKLFRKRKVLNLLGMLTVMVTTGTIVEPWATGGCSLLFYEPDKPELLGKVTKEELLGTK